MDNSNDSATTVEPSGNEVGPISVTLVLIFCFEAVYGEFERSRNDGWPVGKRVLSNIRYIKFGYVVLILKN